MSRYITTTLPYVNADPHLGHALEFVQADFLARTARMRGEATFLNVGTDEHGLKIAQRAEATGQEPQAYADEYAARFKAFADALDISYDSFVRTTDARHEKAAQAFWKRCADAGDIYKATYEVKYCVGCELEKTDSELVNGRCPLHPNLELEIREEENYYFRFSKYGDTLLAQYEGHPEFVVPDGRMRELTAFVSTGLKDFSISRPKDKLSWGVPVPGDEAHVMYVWFDALVNYVSAIGWPEDEGSFSKWWPATQLAGKDNLRQQTAMWQAMLLSAGLPLSKEIFIHGFITSGGQKMSKSLGNVIDPMKIMTTYGVDALRYVLLRHVNPYEDSDLTEDSIRAHYTAHLTNGLGNLVARVMKLAEEHLPHPAKLSRDTEVVDSRFLSLVESFRFNDAMDIVFEKIAHADAYMTKYAPYKGIKSGDTVERERARDQIENLVGQIAAIAVHLTPALPRTAAKIAAAVRKNQKPENLFPRIV